MRLVENVVETGKKYTVPKKDYEDYLAKYKLKLKDLPPGSVEVVKDVVRAGTRGDFVEFWQDPERPGWMVTFDRHSSGVAHNQDVESSKNALHPMQCKQAFDAIAPKVAPSLRSRSAAAARRSSKAMKEAAAAAKQLWSVSEIDAWIKDPNRKMPERNEEEEGGWRFRR